MKRFNPTVFTALCLLATSSLAQTTKDTAFYRIKIEDYYGASGRAITYLVTWDSLKIITSCDFVGCEKKVIYEQVVGYNVSLQFSGFVSKLRIDTLRDNYEARGFDGLERLVTIQYSKKVKYILLERFHHPTVDKLVFEIKNLITDDKYKKID